MFCLAMTMLLSAGIEVWTEPSLVQVMERTHRSAYAKKDVHLYAARGEYESVQICILAGKQPVSDLRLAAEGLSGGIEAPRIARLGYLHITTPSPRATGPWPYWPDVLLDAAPIQLNAGELAVYWVTYWMPPEAKPGTHRGAVRLFSGTKCIKKVPVKLRVFDFTLPALPSLPVWFAWSPGGLGDNLDAWQSACSLLASYRISFGGPKRMKQEINDAYALAQGKMACLSVDGTASPALIRAQAKELAEKAWLPRACVPMLIPESRGEWPAFTKQLLGLSQIEERLPRLLMGVPHPSLERLADRWAIPLGAYAQTLVSRWREGISMAEIPVPAPVSATASSCGLLPNTRHTDAQAEDACDGSFSSAWVSKRTPTGNNPEWLQIDYAEPVTAREVEIDWVPGMASDTLEVLLSSDGSAFAERSVAWTPHGAAQAYEPQVSRGQFRFESTFQSIRFVFRHTEAKGPVGMAEILLNPEQDRPAPTLISAIEPWLMVDQGTFPSFGADAHPAEARMIPWIAWGHGFLGTTGGTLNAWPATWKGEAASVWENGGDGGGYLLYPGPSCLWPSVRLERLRDGMEDYEYLKALAQAVNQGKTKDRKAKDYSAQRLFEPKPARAQLDRFVQDLIQTRVRMLKVLEKVQK